MWLVSHRRPWAWSVQIEFLQPLRFPVHHTLYVLNRHLEESGNLSRLLQAAFVHLFDEERSADRLPVLRIYFATLTQRTVCLQRNPVLLEDLLDPFGRHATGFRHRRDVIAPYHEEEEYIPCGGPDLEEWLRTGAEAWRRRDSRGLSLGHWKSYRMSLEPDK